MRQKLSTSQVSSRLCRSGVDNSGQFEVSSVANAVISGRSRLNGLGAPPIVNFGLSLELYIKLLRHLADGPPVKGHNLHKLFLGLEEAAPSVASIVMRKHHYVRGDRDVFLDYLMAEAKVFEGWCYAHEEEALCSSADTLFTLANAFRDAIRDLHPIWLVPS